MFEILGKTFSSFRHPGVWVIILLSAALSAAILFGLFWLLGEVAREFEYFESWYLVWLNWLVEYGVQAVAAVAAWFIFPIFIPAIASIFEDFTADIVEKKEYGLEKPEDGVSIAGNIWLVLRVPLYNLLVVPLYFLPVLGLILFYVFNAFLLSNTMMRIVAARRIGPKEAKKLAGQKVAELTGWGLLLMLIANLPYFSVLTPVIAIILMVHLFQRFSGR